jgi:hypothetical protein
MKPSIRSRRRGGQIVIALILMLLALCVLALVNVDVFLALRSKARMGNAGDAAALAAARWQGLTLNLVGELNLARLEAVCRYAKDPERARDAAEAILALQERLVFAGPIMGLHAAHVAALHNHAPCDAAMKQLVDEACARALQREAPPDGTWPGKWRDYADMLRGVAADGLAAGCDNAQLFDPAADFTTGHPLHNKAFYEAVAGEDWCWFYLRDEMFALLSGFNGWRTPEGARPKSEENPEFFPLGLSRAPLDALAMRDILPELAESYALENVSARTLDEAGESLVNARPWYVYSLDEWRAWEEMDLAKENPLPLLGAPKAAYNVFGACAAARVRTSLKPFTPEVGEKTIVWTAAAKPFGHRTQALGDEPVTRWNGQLFPLVTPDFHDVRLIPLAGANTARLGTSDKEWLDHVRAHVPAHVETGDTAKACRWCRALESWRQPDFRRRGVDWLETNSDQCLMPGPGGPGPRGGTRHAH